DVILANQAQRATRIWDPENKRWVDTSFPEALVSSAKDRNRDRGFRFGRIKPAGEVITFFRNEDSKGAWSFDGEQWREEPKFFDGLIVKGEPVLTSQAGRDRGVRLRDVDNDGHCELLVANDKQNAIFHWSDSEDSWKKLNFALPEGTSIVNAEGEDNGLRF